MTTPGLDRGVRTSIQRRIRRRKPRQGLGSPLLAAGVALLLGALAALGGFAPAAAAATTWTVTNTGDSATAECPNATKCTLRAAVTDAHSGDTIVLGAGTFKLEHSQVRIYEKNLTIKGAGSGATTLTTSATERLLEVEDDKLAVSGITFSGGSALYGGALYIDEASARISDCAFTNNKAERGTGAEAGYGGAGGAIYLYGDLSMSGTTFTGNEAQGGSGATGGSSNGGGDAGAIYQDEGELTLDSDTFSKNVAGGGATDSGTTGAAAGGVGGAIYTYGELSINGSTFSSNSAAGGGTTDGDTHGGYGSEAGAIYTEENSTSITASTFANNTAAGGADGSSSNYGDAAAGGAIDVEDGQLTVTASALTGNVAGSDPAGHSTAYGGAIFAEGETRIVQSTIASNQAQDGYGGGVYGDDPPLGITQSTIGPANSADYGGGVFFEEPGYAINSTIAGNTAADYGGGLYADAPFSLYSDTIADNAAQATRGGGNIYVYRYAIAMADTLIAGGTSPVGGGNCAFESIEAIVVSEGDNAEDADECELTGPGDLVNAKLALGPLRGNGGPTQTIALSAGSAAIDAGNPAGCIASEAGGVLLVDERGVARPQGPRCSIGAFEYVPPAPRDSGLALSPSSFAPESRGGSIASADAAHHHTLHKGTTVRYRDSEAGTTSFEVLRLQDGYKKGRSCRALVHGKRPKHTRACTIETGVGSFSRSDRAGSNSFTFSGRMRNRGLRDGEYRLTAKPRYYAVPGASTVRVRFKIV